MTVLDALTPTAAELYRTTWGTFVAALIRLTCDRASPEVCTQDAFAEAVAAATLVD